MLLPVFKTGLQTVETMIFRNGRPIHYDYDYHKYFERWLQFMKFKGTCDYDLFYDHSYCYPVVTSRDQKELRCSGVSPGICMRLFLQCINYNVQKHFHTSLFTFHFGKDNTIQKYLQVRNASMAPLHNDLGIWKTLSLGNDSREKMHFFVVSCMEDQK